MQPSKGLHNQVVKIVVPYWTVPLVRLIVCQQQSNFNQVCYLPWDVRFLGFLVTENKWLYLLFLLDNSWGLVQI